MSHTCFIRIRHIRFSSVKGVEEFTYLDSNRHAVKEWTGLFSHNFFANNMEE